MAQEQQSQFRTVPKIFRLSLVLALSASTRDCKYGLSMDILQFGGNALFCLLFPGSGYHSISKNSLQRLWQQTSGGDNSLRMG